MKQLWGAPQLMPVARVSSEEIDQLNIRNATYRAMNLAVDRLGDQPKFVLIDGDAGDGNESAA